MGRRKEGRELCSLFSWNFSFQVASISDPYCNPWSFFMGPTVPEGLITPWSCLQILHPKGLVVSESSGFYILSSSFLNTHSILNLALLLSLCDTGQIASAHWASVSLHGNVCLAGLLWRARHHVHRASSTVPGTEGMLPILWPVLSFLNTWIIFFLAMSMWQFGIHILINRWERLEIHYYMEKHYNCKSNK